MRAETRTVRLTYDSDTDMGYLYLQEIPPGGVEHTEALVVDTAGGRRLINLDFDASGTLIGIEFDGARAALPAALLVDRSLSDD